ncbi:hypothetical protein RR48_05780 [Papilio machaon]|uniref:Uncharacterized protein n=1 Tax=Papilio machaon TaxID=76193 RepID=A0A0N0PE12_PAPMA|nr:hypothetical protein RR48_05780 [Papilio machaon]
MARNLWLLVFSVCILNQQINSFVLHPAERPSESIDEHNLKEEIFVLSVFIAVLLESTILEACKQPSLNNLNDEGFRRKINRDIQVQNYADIITNAIFAHVLRKFSYIISVPRALGMAAILNFLQLVAGFFAFILDNNYMAYILPNLWGIITGVIR